MGNDEILQRLFQALNEADAIMIGGGAGLSTAAGFTYSGPRFEKYFADFEERYGFHDMYSGGFYPYQSQEEYWAYWSRYIYVNRYMDPPFRVYEELLSLVHDKDYFVLTTNVDHCFQKAGFDKKRLFYTQGDYGLFQCSVPCHYKTYDNKETISAMYETQKDMRIPSALIPHCPICGKVMSVNLRADDKFVQDQGWREADERYESFRLKHRFGKVLYLELGVGSNTPDIIKYPFWQMVGNNPQAVYACVNLEGAFSPREIEKQSILAEADIKDVVSALLKLKEKGK